MHNSVVHYSGLVQDARQRYYDIFLDVDKYFQGLGGVMSYFSSGDNLINKTLFSEVDDQGKKKHFVTDRDVDNVLMFRQLHLGRIDKILKDLDGDTLLNESQKKFLYNKAIQLKYAFDMMQYVVYIEAEKGGLLLDPILKKDYLHRIELYETLLYGPRVSDDETEVACVVGYLRGLLHKNCSVLNHPERTLFEDFLARYKVSNDLEFSTLDVTSEKQLSSDVVVCILQKVFAIYGQKSIFVRMQKDIEAPYEKDGVHYLPVGCHRTIQKKYFVPLGLDHAVKIILSDTADNVSQARNKNLDDHRITFPIGNNYSFTRICQLIDHEIDTHFVRGYNDASGLDIKSAGYETTEEGIAMGVNEQLAVVSLDDVSIDQPTIHHISTFIAENYDSEQTKKLLFIYYKIIGKSHDEAEKMAKSRTQRVKRYHANDLPGANRKDVVYWRGMKIVVDYLKNVDTATLQRDVDLIYSGRFTHTDLPHIAGLFDGLKVDASKRISPLALGKILYERYQGNQVSKQALQAKDKRFSLDMQQLTFFQKRQLLNILRLLD